MTGTFESILHKLQTDKQSGALSLAIRTLEDFEQYLSSAGSVSRRDLLAMAGRLAKARPSMHALGNALSHWQAALEQDQNSLIALQVVIDSLKQAGQQVIQHALELIQPEMKILVHSRSSLISGVFAALSEQGIPVEVFATLSAPGHEGRVLASEINQLGIPVTLITDAGMGQVMPGIDLNLSGCDCWLSDGYFVNKTGTLLQALAARDSCKPFWVLADSFKNSPQTRKTVELERHPEAALDLPAPAIRGINIWFETISARLISGRVDESGCQHFTTPRQPR